MNLLAAGKDADWFYGEKQSWTIIGGEKVYLKTENFVGIW